MSCILQFICAFDAATKCTYVDRLRSALGDKATLLYPLLPGLHTLITTEYHFPELSMDVEDLPSKTMQARFTEALLKFLVCCAMRPFPLVLCIDDLQWADSASISLFVQLLRALLNSDTKDLRILFIGAYRTDDEATGLVRKAIDQLRCTGLTVAELELTALCPLNTEAMLADLFPSTGAPVLKKLTSTVLQKTRGNAFFTLRFLQGLYRDGVVRFDFDAGGWIFDMVR